MMTTRCATFEPTRGTIPNIYNPLFSQNPTIRIRSYKGIFFHPSSSPSFDLPNQK